MYACIDETVNIRLIATNLFWHNWCLSCLVLLIFSVSTEIDDVNHNISQYKKSGASSHKICLKPSFMTMSGMISDQSFTYRYMAIVCSWHYNGLKIDVLCALYLKMCTLQQLLSSSIITNNNFFCLQYKLLHQLHQLQYWSMPNLKVQMPKLSTSPSYYQLLKERNSFSVKYKKYVQPEINHLIWTLENR